MLDFHRSTQIAVEREHDLVVLRVGHAEEKYSYPRAFNLAQDMRVLAKVAMAAEGVAHAVHRAETFDDAGLEAMDDALATAAHVTYRRSSNQPGNRTNLALDKGVIYLMIGNTKMGMHWKDALTLSGWFRLRAKEAKRWAGDRGKRMRIRGMLTNAQA